jgi:arginyl-tRNA synthetase
LKPRLHQLIARALTELRDAGTLPIDSLPEIHIEPPRHEAHGDLSTNVAMLLAKPCRKPPLEIAKLLAGRLVAPGFIEKVDVAPPGFINFFLNSGAVLDVLPQVLEAGPRFGTSELGGGRRVQVEFVSANPTGPLHVGHGRGAAYGAVLASLLSAVGYEVCREYYVNDAGRQMDILALSVWVRYLELCDRKVALPRNCYQGEYVRDIASALHAAHGSRFDHADAAAFPAPAASDEEVEAVVDASIEHCRRTLGEAEYRMLHAFGCQSILDGIKLDLADFGVEFDNWYSERSLVEQGLFDKALDALRASGYMYVQDGAEWFRSSALGDEKDRVVVRDNGIPTYFASDIAYHADKFDRGFEEVINVWGADHHGYIPRVKAALKALGQPDDKLEILLVQFATLYRGGEKVQMSTRSGEFVTLRQLFEDVGRDAARFYYITRRSDQHLDFDLDLAKTQSQDNLVYYIQYAHARICSVFRQLAQAGQHYDERAALAAIGRLTEKREHALAALIARYPEVVATAAGQREPHLVANYLKDLATDFHGFYNTHKIMVDDTALRDARLALARAVQTVLANGLGLLGVSAPAEM